MFFTVCIDCEVDWEDWNECEGGTRSRSQIITVEPEGAGKVCPQLKSESESLL